MPRIYDYISHKLSKNKLLQKQTLRLTFGISMKSRYKQWKLLFLHWLDAECGRRKLVHEANPHNNFAWTEKFPQENKLHDASRYNNKVWFGCWGCGKKSRVPIQIGTHSFLFIPALTFHGHKQNLHPIFVILKIKWHADFLQFTGTCYGTFFLLARSRFSASFNFVSSSTAGESMACRVHIYLQ